MRNTIIDIREKLEEGLYKNEEQIRFSLVARILQKLDWDIWEPQEVYTEFSPDGERNKVDVALFVKPQRPTIFIELKAPDKLHNSNELKKAEDQLRDYNVNLTALFTILTDGNQWRFYHSQQGGSFSQKCFKVFEIQSNDVEDIEFSILTFLSKNEIIYVNSKEEAATYLQLNRKQKTMEKLTPSAKREQENDPFLSLVDALDKVVKEKGENIKRNEIIDFLKFETPKKRLRKSTIKNEKPTILNEPNDTKSMSKKRYSISNQYELSFTKITSGEIDGEYANNWQKLLRIIIRKQIKNGMQIDEIKNITSLNIQKGDISGNGFYLIPDTNYSIQNVDANRAGASILKLAIKSNIKLNIQFFWRDKPGQAAFPNEQCEMIN